MTCVIAYCGIITKVLKPGCMFELDASKILLLSQNHANTLQLGLRVGVRLRLKNTHLVKTTFRCNKNLNKIWFYVCDHSNLDIIEFSDLNSGLNELTCGSYQDTRFFYDLWNDMNVGDYILCCFLIEFFKENGIMEDMDDCSIFDSARSLLSLFGWTPTESTSNLYQMNHNTTCEAMRLSFGVPSLPNLSDIFNSKEILEWKSFNTSVSLNTRSLQYQNDEFLIGILTQDSNGILFLSNKFVSIPILFIADNTIFHLQYNTPYCVKSQTICIESYFISNEKTPNHSLYLAFKKSSLVPLQVMEPNAIKRFKLGYYTHLILIERIGTLMQVSGVSSLTAHGILFKLDDHSTKNLKLKIISSFHTILKILAPYLALFNELTHGSTILVDLSGANLEILKSDSKLIQIDSNSQIKEIRVEIEDEGNADSIVLDSAADVEKYYEAVAEIKAKWTTIHDCIKYMNTLDEKSNYYVNLEGYLVVKQCVHKEQATNLNSLLITVLDHQTRASLNVYLDSDYGFPIGLIKGAKISITMLKIQRSKTSNQVYATLNCESRLRVLSIIPPDEFDDTPPTYYLIDILSSQAPALCTITVKVEIMRVKKLSFSIKCGGCGGVVVDSECQMQCDNNDVGVDYLYGKVVCEVYDGSAHAILSFEVLEDVLILLCIDSNMKSEIESLVSCGRYEYEPIENLSSKYTETTNQNWRAKLESRMESITRHSKVTRKVSLNVTTGIKSQSPRVTGFGYALDKITQIKGIYHAPGLYVNGFNVSEIDYRRETNLILSE